MSSDKTKKYEGSEHELRAQTLELDGLHHDVGMPAMAEALARHARHQSPHLPHGRRRRGGRRRRAGCRQRRAAHVGCRVDPPSLRRVDAAAFPPSGLKGDLAVAAVAASLENLAVFAYTSGLSAATAGKLGTVPPAVATFATTVKGQHQQHAAAWNAVLKSHGKAPVTVTNPTLTPTVQSDFAKVTDITGLAQLALTLETIAAQTYQVETSKLQSSAAIQLSSSIQPVEMQHIAILYYVLGMYPGAQTSSGTPLAFNPTSQAV